MSISQPQIDNSISVLDNLLIDSVLKAAKSDRVGNWDKAECYLEEADSIRREIGVLNSICEDATKEVVPNSDICDITAVGIGVWAIAEPILGSSVGCTVFTIGGQSFTPPPFGEITITEFETEEFTEIIIN